MILPIGYRVEFGIRRERVEDYVSHELPDKPHLWCLMVVDSVATDRPGIAAIRVGSSGFGREGRGRVDGSRVFDEGQATVSV